jgi:hypothetical protein
MGTAAEGDAVCAILTSPAPGWRNGRRYGLKIVDSYLVKISHEVEPAETSNTRGPLPVTYPFVFFVSRAAISIETRRAIRMAGKS